MSERSEHQIYADLLRYYSTQVSAHVGPVVSMFFGVVGLLIIISGSNTFASRVFFSLIYFSLCALGAYFYGRLMYFGKMVDEVLQRPEWRSCHEQIREKVMGESTMLKIVAKVSEKRLIGYRLTWAWIMLGCAWLAAFLSWAVVFFQL